MIYALRLERQGIRLYNADTGEYKVVDAYLLANLIQRGMEIANTGQLQEMLSKGKRYTHFIKGMSGNTKLTVASIDSPDQEEVISAYNLDASNFCNAETYRMCLFDASNTTIQTSLVETSNWNAVLLDYTVPSEVDYCKAKEMVYKIDSDLEQINEQLLMFGRDLSDIGLEEARESRGNLGKVPVYSPMDIEYDSSFVRDDVYNMPQGANLCSGYFLRQAPELRAVIFPSTFYANNVSLAVYNSIDTLDMRKASINELVVKVRGNGFYKRSFDTTVTNLYLPDRLVHLREGESSYNTSSLEPKYLLAKNVFVGKNVKTIGYACLRAHCIIFERGINLESIADFGVVARYIIMSDDPNYDYYVNKEPVDGDGEADLVVDLDLGDVDMTPNSIRIFDVRNAIKLRMDTNKFKTGLNYHLDIVDKDGRKLRGW